MLSIGANVPRGKDSIIKVFAARVKYLKGALISTIWFRDIPGVCKNPVDRQVTPASVVDPVVELHEHVSGGPDFATGRTFTGRKRELCNSRGERGQGTEVGSLILYGRVHIGGVKITQRREPSRTFRVANSRKGSPGEVDLRKPIKQRPPYLMFGQRPGA
jgi:hypothetical protein